MSTALKPHVLVVDDDESVREVFALLLPKEATR
jgi:CheY-like chemotaxis protein